MSWAPEFLVLLWDISFNTSDVEKHENGDIVKSDEKWIPQRWDQYTLPSAAYSGTWLGLRMEQWHHENYCSIWF